MPSDLRDTRLFYDKPDAVRRLQVWFGDLLFVLTQTNAVWQMQAPVSDTADQRAVKDAVEQLLRLKAERIIDAGDRDPSNSGGEQSPPISYVEVVSDHVSQRFTIAPDDYEGRFYRVAFTNAPTVFLVANSNVPPAFVSMVGLLGLRDKTVFSLSAGSVRRITVRRSGGGGRCSRRRRRRGVAAGGGVTGKVNAGISACGSPAGGSAADGSRNRLALEEWTVRFRRRGRVSVEWTVGPVARRARRRDAGSENATRWCATGRAVRAGRGGFACSPRRGGAALSGTETRGGLERGVGRWAHVFSGPRRRGR
jgi:hypothetical protein